MRTEQQIQADLQAAYDAMEREARKPERKWPCEECRWDRGLRGHGYCHNPLVKGLRKPNWNYDIAKRGGYVSITDSRLCGPEKVLWEPKPTLCERFVELVQSLFLPHKKG